MELRLRNFKHCPILRKTLESSDVINGGAELFLYQTGYLTIKSSDESGLLFFLIKKREYAWNFQLFFVLLRQKFLWNSYQQQEVKK